MENQSKSPTVISCFLRVTDHLESICKKFTKKVPKAYFLQIDFKWSETRKKPETDGGFDQFFV